MQPGDTVAKQVMGEVQLDAHCRQHEAEEQAASVAHEDAGSAKVVAQKAEARAEQGNRKRGDQCLIVQGGESEEKQTGDGAHPTGQPVMLSIRFIALQIPTTHRMVMV